MVYSGVFSFDLQAQIHVDSTVVENKLDTLRKKDVFDVIEGLFDIKKPETMEIQQSENLIFLFCHLQLKSLVVEIS